MGLFDQNVDNSIKSDSGVQALISSGQVIEFHNPRGRSSPLKFAAFLTDFSDTVTANFEEQNVYARMDPIFSYQNTVRVINFALEVPSFSPADARTNLDKIKKLQRMLYPSYGSVDKGVYVLTNPPLFQIKFNNLISDGTGKLMGVVESIDFTPLIEQGMFYEGNKFYPKAYSFSCLFKPLHKSIRSRAWLGKATVPKQEELDRNDTLGPALGKGINLHEEDGAFGEGISVDTTTTGVDMATLEGAAPGVAAVTTAFLAGTSNLTPGQSPALPVTTGGGIDTSGYQ